MDDMITTTDKMDSFFLNLSDGMPMYSNDTMYYCGDEAVNHTKDMVNKMRKMGINILSYFISDYDSETTLQDFKTMYGQDAENINVSSVTQIAKTMNNMFLTK
jgi:nitric oxide reductase activation protein